MDQPKLTARQAKFVEAYLLSGNATDAARKAGYSKKTAYSIGEENLRKPEVQKALHHAYTRRQEKFEVDEARIIEELARIAFFDIKSIMETGAKGVVFKPWAEIEDRLSAAIESVAETHNSFGSSVKVKSHDKIKALELIGTHIGMWRDKAETDANAELKAAVDEAIQKLNEGSIPK